MPLSSPAWALKEGDTVEDKFGKFRVVVEAYQNTGCDHCDRKPFDCARMKCTKADNGGTGFILLTEINYLTHRLTK